MAMATPPTVACCTQEDFAAHKVAGSAYGIEGLVIYDIEGTDLFSVILYSVAMNHNNRQAIGIFRKVSAAAPLETESENCPTSASSCEHLRTLAWFARADPGMGFGTEQADPSDFRYKLFDEMYALSGVSWGTGLDSTRAPKNEAYVNDANYQIGLSYQGSSTSALKVSLDEITLTSTMADANKANQKVEFYHQKVRTQCPAKERFLFHSWSAHLHH